MLTYFLDNLTVAMFTTGLIGIFGNMVEPGRVPKLMIIVASVYLLVYISARLIWAALNSRKPAKRTVKNPRKFQMYDMKESA